MSVKLAVTYCGIGAGLLVREGTKPMRIAHKRLLYLRDELDGWLDRLAGKLLTAAAAGEWD